MTNLRVRFKIMTPLGEYLGRLDTIPNDKTAFRDYVEEATSLIVDAEGGRGVANFTDSRGRVVFIMPETLKNSVITVERVDE